MNKLYGKIFLGFWLATIAILASWMLLGRYVDMVPDAGPAMHPGHFGPPPQVMVQLVYGLEHVPMAELEAWLAGHSRNMHSSIFLIDADGHELFGRPIDQRALVLAERLFNSRRRAHLRSDDANYFGHRILRDDTGPLAAIVAFERPPPPLVRLLVEHLWLRLLLAVIISGIICYLISRFLTQRLKRLQLAAQDLASGNLDARIDVADHGGDETDALARDFNRMASQLKERILGQKRLLYDVSHELRSPLARMRVALALAEREEGHSSERLKRIEQEADRLEDLIGQLLIVPDAQLVLEDSIDLVALLDQLTRDAEFESAASGKHVVFDTQETEAVVRTHGDMLSKAIENILRNGIHYTPQHSTVTLSLARQDSDWEIRVADQGPGVPAHLLGRLFDEFFRVDEARQRDTGGYGLGLFIARRAVEQHGGSITASNADPGLVVIVRLPAAAAEIQGE